MQTFLQQEKEQAKVMMANELAEMMSTLDGYKHNSEKMFASKDLEIEKLKNEHKDFKSKILVSI